VLRPFSFIGNPFFFPWVAYQTGRSSDGVSLLLGGGSGSQGLHFSTPGWGPVVSSSLIVTNGFLDQSATSARGPEDSSSHVLSLLLPSFQSMTVAPFLCSSAPLGFKNSAAFVLLLPASLMETVSNLFCYGPVRPSFLIPCFFIPNNPTCIPFRRMAFWFLHDGCSSPGPESRLRLPPFLPRSSPQLGRLL